MKRLRSATAVAAALVLAAVLAAGCGTTKIVTVAEPTKTNSTPPNSSATNQAPAKHPLTIGDAATLAGEKSGERLEATLMAYKEALSVGEYDKPDSGMKYVGVILKLRNVGTAPYSDSPSNGATILTASGQHGKTTIIGSGECSEDFDSSVKIAPGESQEGCIPFELPEEDAAARFQWTPASGFGEETAEWTIAPGAGSQATQQQTHSSTQESMPSSSPNGPLDAVNNYWSDIGAHNFGGAYGYVVPGSTGLSESQFVSSEEQANIENVQFHGQITSSSGSTASVEVVSLVTHDQQYGCRTWTGSYDMIEQGGGWLIERANLSPRSC